MEPYYRVVWNIKKIGPKKLAGVIMSRHTMSVSIVTAIAVWYSVNLDGVSGGGKMKKRLDYRYDLANIKQCCYAVSSFRT